MKKNSLFFGIFILIAYALIFPSDAIKATQDALLLWYQKVLPTLLPFAIFSNILISSNCITALTSRFFKRFGKIPVSEDEVFVLCTGLLFGFPMGSKNCAELLKKEKISKKEADSLLLMSNHISPAFISGYLLTDQLGLKDLFPVSIALLYGPALLLGTAGLCKIQMSFHEKKEASRSQINFKIIDAGIMNGCDTLVKIGGYMMLFALIGAAISKVPMPGMLYVIFMNLLEITNGLHLLALQPLDLRIKYSLAMAFTAFGGLSGIAQTGSMIRGTSLSIRKYVCQKILLSGISFLLAWCISFVYGI